MKKCYVLAARINIKYEAICAELRVKYTIRKIIEEALDNAYKKLKKEKENETRN